MNSLRQMFVAKNILQEISIEEVLSDFPHQKARKNLCVNLD